MKKSKKFTKKEIRELVDTVISDLKHQTPERQEVNDKNMELSKPISVQIKKRPSTKKVSISKAKTVSGSKKNV